MGKVEYTINHPDKRWGTFLLRVNDPGGGHRSLELLHDGELVRGNRNQPLGQTPLSVLLSLVDKPEKKVSYTDIISNANLHGDNADGTIKHYISVLSRAMLDGGRIRRILGYSETHRTAWIQFDVKKKGDYGSVVAFPKWADGDLGRLIDECCAECETETNLDDCNIRISTFGFPTNPHHLIWNHESRRKLRYRILLVNPWNRPMLLARFALREDTHDKVEDPFRNLTGQVRALKNLQDRFDLANNNRTVNAIKASCPFEWKLTNNYPCGFQAITASKAHLGLFPALGNFETGPHFEISKESDIWSFLKTDFDARWDAADWPHELPECAEFLNLH